MEGERNSESLGYRKKAKAKARESAKKYPIINSWTFFACRQEKEATIQQQPTPNTFLWERKLNGILCKKDTLLRNINNKH